MIQHLFIPLFVISASLDVGAKAANLTKDSSAPPIWARFYEIETGRPSFCDRDGVVGYDIEDIGGERRKGYASYGSSGEKVARAYAKWPYR